MRLTHTCQFGIENKDGSKETRTSTLVEYADPKGQLSALLQGKYLAYCTNVESGYSAMAKLVGVPCAVAVLKVLDGTIKEKGILAPMTPELNNPM